MTKEFVINQTQFASEEPLMDGQIRMPNEEHKEVDPQVLAFKTRRRVVIMAVSGFLLIVLGLYFVVKMSSKQTPNVGPLMEISPTPSSPEVELSLREQIDLLSNSVGQLERPSRGLAYPPVEVNIGVKELK